MENRPPGSAPLVQQLPPPPPKPPAELKSSSAATGMTVVLMSLFAYPGSGHLMSKATFRGTVWAVLFTLTFFPGVAMGLFGIYRLYTSMTTLNDVGDMSTLFGPCLVVLALAGVVYVGAALDAFFLALRRPPSE